MLSLITFIPLLGILLILFTPADKKAIMKWSAAGVTFLQVLMAIYIYVHYDYTAGGVNDAGSFQFVEQMNWITAFNIQYYLGIDGLSTPMVLLTALLSFLCIFVSWNIEKGLRGYLAMFLLLDTGMMGVFVALDFFLFYIFWEVMLLPMYFLIGIWGGPRRIYAAIKFFLYTLLGSVLMLVAMLGLYYTSGLHTFNMISLMSAATTFNHATIHLFGMVLPFDKLMFILLFIGFAIKVPVFPFHTWLPDAHVEAPTAISVILAGVLLKMGTYGIIRISYPMLPDASVWFSGFLALLGVINIIYGALCAMAQNDMKKLIAYSSISHMGFVMLGMAAFTPQGINGALFQMFNHGTITAMLFIVVGVIYDRAHHRDIDKFGGLANRLPLYTVWTSFAFFAGLGLPGLSSFISEALVLIGSFKVYPSHTILAGTGIILGAAYLLWTLQRMFFGPFDAQKYEQHAHLSELVEINGREIFTLAPLAVIVLVLGVYPMPVLNLMSSSVTQLLTIFQPLLGH
ncbi:MAG: NADH-quinone oxidoreductase subunit M [Gemmatimonadetes bacterium]|nr:MAG: NADH-quinone oxidoreductase subunit M [Gemmatimonadota bacterium]